MTEYNDLADSTESDPTREATEKETAFYFSKQDDRLVVTSSERTIMRRVLSHPEFELRSYSTTMDGDKTGVRSVTEEEYAADGHDGRKPVYSVTGTLPIGAIKISAKSRQSNAHSSVVSDGVL